MISVIVPTRNRAAELERQLAALEQQRFDGAWEVIVVDNGSSDDTVSVAQRWADRLPLRVVDGSDRVGASAARNRGAAMASGQTLLFVDDDDVVEEGWLSSMADGDGDLLAGAVRSPGRQIQTPDTYFFLPYALGCNMGVGRDTFENIGGFDERLATGEDVDFSWRAQLSGWKFAQVPDACVTISPRTTNSGRFRQYAAYANGEAVLYRRYRCFGLRRSWKRLFRRVGWMIRHLPSMRTHAWICSAGTLYGWAQGSIQQRVLYFGGT